MGRGEGNDGGVVAVKRNILVSKAKVDRSSYADERKKRMKWTTCSISGDRLAEPVRELQSKPALPRSPPVRVLFSLHITGLAMLLRL